MFSSLLQKRTSCTLMSTRPSKLDAWAIETTRRSASPRPRWSLSEAGGEPSRSDLCDLPWGARHVPEQTAELFQARVWLCPRRRCLSSAYPYTRHGARAVIPRRAAASQTPAGGPFSITAAPWGSKASSPSEATGRIAPGGRPLGQGQESDIAGSD
jgi:hypothetical protein